MEPNTQSTSPIFVLQFELQAARSPQLSRGGMFGDCHACHSPGAAVLRLHRSLSAANGALTLLDGRDGSFEASRRKRTRSTNDRRAGAVASLGLMQTSRCREHEPPLPDASMAARHLGPERRGLDSRECLTHGGAPVSHGVKRRRPFAQLQGWSLLQIPTGWTVSQIPSTPWARFIRPIGSSQPR